MINSWDDITSRFEAIKDHKPKAAKKLNELGDILASAYKLNPDRADEMWQYIIELNIADDITNAKFYIAQVFKKLTERLSAEEATDYIAMTPTRIQLMLQYGYDGSTLWQVVRSLVEGFIKIGNANNCVIVLDYAFDKFGGVTSGRNEVFSLASSAIAQTNDIRRRSKAYNETIEEFLRLLTNIEDEKTAAYAQIALVNAGFEEEYDIEFLLDLCIQHVFSSEFVELLWKAREAISESEAIEKWETLIARVNDFGGRVPEVDTAMRDMGIGYKGSDLYYYVSLVKNSAILLEAYFTRGKMGNLNELILRDWIEQNQWELLSEYLSKALISTEEYAFTYNFWESIKCFTEMYDNKSGIYYTDPFGGKYDSINKKNANTFCSMLAKVSAMTLGCSCHDLFQSEIKDFIEKATGSYNLLNEYGFEEVKDERSAYEQYKEYIHEFLLSGEISHQHNPIYHKLHQRLIEDNHDTNLNYQMAQDDEIAEFYFKHTNDFSEKAYIIISCIKENDIDRALYLLNLMFETEEYEGYDELNGWGRQLSLVMQYVVKAYDRNDRYYWSGDDITDEMIEQVTNLVNIALEHVPKRERQEVKNSLLKLKPNADTNAEYIRNLLEDVEVYATFPKPRGKGGAPNINRMSREISDSFEILSRMGRIDVVSQIMTKFASVRTVLKPITFSGWFSTMRRELKSEDWIQLYRMNPDIFDAWLADLTVREWDIIEIAHSIGEGCTRAEFREIRNLIVSHRGNIEGLDSAFKVTSENTETQLLFDGENAKIELDFLEINGYDPIGTAEFHLLTTRRTKELSSVRIISCKINGIETDNIGSYSDFDDDDGPNIGYSVWRSESQDELTVYSNFFEENHINQIDRIELQMVLMDEDANEIENMSTVVIELDSISGEYRVTKEAKSQGSLIRGHELDDEDDTDGCPVEIDIEEIVRKALNRICHSEEDKDSEDEYDDESDEDEVYLGESADFEDITFWDKAGIRIDFCGLEFEDEDLRVSFWSTNHSSETIKLFAKDVCVNGNHCAAFSHIQTLEVGKFDYSVLDVTSKTDISYDSIETIDFSIEIDDAENHEKYETLHIHIECDTDDESFTVRIAPYQAVITDDEEEDEEDLDFEDDTDFEDITFWNESGIRIDFCGLEFEDDEIFVKFWSSNRSSETINLFAKDVWVNGKNCSSFAHFHRLNSGDSGFETLNVTDETDIPYDSIETIDFSVEIDDDENHEKFETLHIHIECDTDDESFTVKIAPYQAVIMDDEEDSNFEDITFWNESGIRIDFCGLEFEDDEIFVKFWSSNRSSETINLFAKDVCVNGDNCTNFSHFHKLNSGDSGFKTLNITDETYIPYNCIRTIDFSVEIDDDENHEKFETLPIHIECDTDNETFTVKIGDYISANSGRVDDELDVYTSDDVFHDITIYDEIDVNIDFCGIEFEDEQLILEFWANSCRDEETNFFFKYLKVNDQLLASYHLFKTLEAGEGEYVNVTLSSSDGKYESIKSIDFCIEVDDEDIDAMGETGNIHINCNMKKETYSVKVEE